jgi:hypothetical protein
VKWRLDSPLAPTAHLVAIDDERVVLCWVYVCCGTCSVVLDDDDGPENITITDEPEIEEPGEDYTKQKCGQ